MVKVQISDGRDIGNDGDRLRFREDLLCLLLHELTDADDVTGSSGEGLPEPELKPGFGDGSVTHAEHDGNAIPRQCESDKRIGKRISEEKKIGAMAADDVMELSAVGAETRQLTPTILGVFQHPLRRKMTAIRDFECGEPQLSAMVTHSAAARCSAGHDDDNVGALGLQCAQGFDVASLRAQQFSADDEPHDANPV